MHSFPLINNLKKCLPILLGISLLGCKKDALKSAIPIDNDVTSSTAAIITTQITVNIDQTQHGFPVSQYFQGLSYETGILTQSPDFLNENNAVLIQMVKSLGKGILRIGGNSSDEIDWTGAARSPETSDSSLTTSDIDRLSAFSKAVGWPVIFNLNLANYNPATAANEAQYVQNSLQGSLYALQSGNEPDVFKLKLRGPSYAYNDFQREWDGYFAAIEKVLPKERFAGPDVDPFNADWLNSFATNEHNNVRLIDGHYYNCGPATDTRISYHDILTQNPKLNGYLVELNRISSKYHMPYRITECNSIWAGGKAGASDVFASSLWALDYMWNVAENKGQGVNFHGGATPRFVYTPIALENNTYVARPEYYAMLAFKQGSTGGSVIPATIVDPRDYNNCTAYATANADSSYSVTLINKEEAKSFTFNIQLTKTAATITVARLTAPSITAKTGVTFSGSAVNADGTFTPATPKIHALNKNNFTIVVPEASAVVITIK